MSLVEGSKRISLHKGADAVRGSVIWRPIKSAWLSAMTVIGLAGVPITFGIDEVFVFLILTSITLCAGHSVGMHRRLIHESFECPLWLEHVLVYLGVLVGMAGPFGMMRQHDLRDWAQRQTECHEYLRHGRGFWLDYFSQCHCDIDLCDPPSFEPEERLRTDGFYRWLERNWMWQQAPLALLLVVVGGWGWVIWGVALRVAVSVTGHWLVGHFAHHDYHHGVRCMSWIVRGAAVQGLDVPVAGLISMGESWHNNHHAYPGSARIGLLDGQPDPGWWFILLLQRFGLAWGIVTPPTMPARAALIRICGRGTGWSVCFWRRRIWRIMRGSAA